MDRPKAKTKTGKSRFHKLRESFPGLVIESVLITFGVLLAFAADNWKSQAKLEKDTELVLHNLQNELIGNRAMVLEWLGYYDSLAVGIGQVMDLSVEVPRHPDAEWLETVYPSPSLSYLPQQTAWQTAQSTHVLRNFQYNTTYNLTHCYRYQLDIETTRQLIFEIMYQSEGGNEPGQKLRALQALYQEVIKKQQYLLGAYRDALIALDQELIKRTS